MCEWYPKVGAAALRYLADHHSGYPGVKPWETPEEWEKYLLYLANRLDRCANSQDILFTDERNEYAEEFHASFEELDHHVQHNPDGTISTWHNETPEFIALREKYFARERELEEADRKYNEETYKWIGQDIGRLWD